MTFGALSYDPMTGLRIGGEEAPEGTAPAPANGLPRIARRQMASDPNEE